LEPENAETNIYQQLQIFKETSLAPLLKVNHKIIDYPIPFMQVIFI